MSNFLKTMIFSIVYYTINLLSNFWITSLLIETLGKELYSFYPIANNLSGWLIIISVAINSMLSRHISVYINKNNLFETEKYYSTAMLSNIFITAILILPIGIISNFADTILEMPEGHVSEIKFLLICVLATVPVNMIEAVLSVAATAKNKLYLEYIARIIQSSIKVVCIVAICYIEKINLALIGLVIFFSDFMLLVTVAGLKRRIMPEVKFIRNSFDYETLKKIIMSGIWNSITQLGNSLLYQFDLIISNIMLGVETAGTISIVLTVPNAMTSLLTTLASVFMPGLYKEYAVHGFEGRFIRKVKYAQFLVGGMIGTAVVLFISFGKIFFDFWVPGNNSEQLGFLSIFYLLPLIVNAMFRNVCNTLIVANKMKIQALTTLINGCLNIVGMYILIKISNLGIYSIVITTFIITILWNAIFIPIHVSRMLKCKVKEFYKAPLALCIILMVVYIISKIIKSLVPLFSSFIQFFLVVGIAAIVCYGIFGIIIIILHKKKIIIL